MIVYMQHPLAMVEQTHFTQTIRCAAVMNRIANIFTHEDLREAGADEPDPLIKYSRF